MKEYRIHFLKLSLQVFFIIFLTISTSNILRAQSNSLKQLKKNVTNLNEKESSTKSSDPWTVNHIITAEELSKNLSDQKSKKPVILQVGFDFLYNEEHIPGTKYAGPASNKKGIDTLKAEVKNLSRDQEIIIYCGCCPWKHCPNIRPAYKTLSDLGFKNVHVLYLPDSFAKDWKDKGYPVTSH